ncbi:MAG TPA: hypothetical protein VGK48_27800 [Terriglobia bacterium]|jgi:hypothetical protein
MKPLLVMLLLATSIQAQSLADAARQERERQAKHKSTVIIRETGAPPAAASPASADGKPNEPDAKPAEARKAVVPPEPDAAALWNAKADELRKKIADLQDQETALQLQQVNQQNQIYAPVVDPVLKDQAQASLSQTIQQLAKTHDDLDMTRKELDAMLAEGPPKKVQVEPTPAQPRPEAQPQAAPQPQP